MNLVCDLHIHSKFSRMTSPKMVPSTISEWAQKKGVQIIATADWTHPDWLELLREELEPAEEGFFVLRGGNDDSPRFVLSAEIACVHPAGTGSRIRHIVLIPSFEDAETIATQLGWIGNLRGDGRPILKMHSEELARIVFSTNEEAVLFPSHVWVPNLSILGFGGFDRLETCYGEFSSHIKAFETGLSSDPAMNQRCSFLDGFVQLSNSDAHSPNTIGRESTVIDLEEKTFSSLSVAIAKNTIIETVEFYPEEGRYHATGHAKCGVVLEPEEMDLNEDIRCPKCGGKITMGVEARMIMLADRPFGYKNSSTPSFRRTLELDAIIAQALGVSIDTKAVLLEYETLLRRLGDEFTILRNATPQEIADVSTFQIGESIRRVREGNVRIKPGYDGEFGSISIFTDNERLELAPQKSLF